MNPKQPTYNQLKRNDRKILEDEKKLNFCVTLLMGLRIFWLYPHLQKGMIIPMLCHMRMNICERFRYLYEYVYFTYAYLAM